MEKRVILFIALLIYSGSVSANILNNGGFESGLQCWGNWVWSRSCPSCEYRGTYDFLLSDDAHGGQNSLEIRCVGDDCGWPGKASISAYGIYGEAEAQYIADVWAKCRGSGFIYLPHDDSIHDLLCDGTWQKNTVEFTSPGEIGIAVYNTGTDSLFVDDLDLRRKDGSSHPIERPNSGRTQVDISGNSVRVDGKPYLAVGFFAVPYNELEEAAYLGANTIVGIGGVTASDCFSTGQGSYLEKAYSLGLHVMPDTTFTARLDDPGIYSDFVASDEHKAVIGWFVDEPDQSGVSWYYIRPEVLAAEHNSLKSATTLPFMVDMQRTWETNAVDIMESYAPAIDIWMAEPYGDDFASLERAVRVMRQADEKPVWLAQDDTGDLIIPKTYYAIVNNVTGIIYFDWSGFSQDSKDKAGQVMRELGNLTGVIFSDDAAGAVKVNDPAISYISRSFDGALYIIAVNPSTSAKQVTFTAGNGSRVQVLFENREIASNGTFSDSFAPKSRHVYAIQQALCTGDTDNDSMVSIQELTAFIGRWHRGESQMPALMKAIRNWKKGC
jgi:hypothetical protein